ncbi:MAG: hypothetical protein DCC44_01060 [Acidobacteria bacterium]|nr:MAG: hypothetical protein DCC44_01060 [Acidobacteriota bacterium]
MKVKNRLSGKTAALTALLASCLLACLFTTTAAGQGPPRPRPPRVEGQTPIGTMNGQPVTANDLIMGINPDSPFMPPLDGSPAPILQQFENQYPANPTATPQPVPVIPPKPAAPSFGEQITNLMRTGQEWLFRSVLDTIIRPLMPILTFLAWIIASFVLIVAFIRRFHDNRGLGPARSSSTL